MTHSAPAQATIFDAIAESEAATAHLRFNGADYIAERDNPRLGAQIARVFEAMKDGQWRTLRQIESMTGDPAPSVSAQLRHLRKTRFGAHTVNRRHLGVGVYQYQLEVSAFFSSDS